MWQHYAGRIVDICVIPLVPPSFRLAIQYLKYTAILGWEPEVKCIQSYARKSTMAIDVGANMGLWTYAMAKSGLFEKVVAFEPNRSLTGDLSNAEFENVTVSHVAVSDKAGTGTLRIPKKGAFFLSGWASLEDQLDLDPDAVQEMAVETVRLDDLDLQDVGFIKIDVEGHEMELLKGAHNFFQRNKPVCLIECRERNRAAVDGYFAGLGFMLVDTKQQYGFALSSNNYLFRHERVPCVDEGGAAT